MNYFGAFLLIWLSVGFIAGLRRTYVDKAFSPEAVEKLRARRMKEGRPVHNKLDGNIPLFLAGSALLGFYAFYLDTVGTFKRKGEK